MALLSKNTHRELEVQVHYDFNCISEYTLRFYQVALIGEKSLDLMITEFYKLKVYFMIPLCFVIKSFSTTCQVLKIKIQLGHFRSYFFWSPYSLSLSQKKRRMNVLFSLCLGVCLFFLYLPQSLSWTPRLRLQYKWCEKLMFYEITNELLKRKSTGIRLNLDLLSILNI